MNWFEFIVKRVKISQPPQKGITSDHKLQNIHAGQNKYKRTGRPRVNFFGAFDNQIIFIAFKNFHS